MTFAIALTFRNYAIREDAPRLNFSEMNAEIFGLLVPAAEAYESGSLSGHWFTLPMTYGPGQSVPTIPYRALDGYVDINPYAGYVYLEADKSQLPVLQAICQRGRLSSDQAYVCKDGAWWTFNSPSSSTDLMRLAEDHELYALNPPIGWTLTHPARQVFGGNTRYWLAVNGNYGMETKRGSNRMVRTLKISSGAFLIISRLFEGQFDDYSSTRSTYHYIDFHDASVLKHKDSNFFYFQVESERLRRLERFTKTLTAPRAYVWFEDGWYTMPAAQGTHLGQIGGEYPYRPASSYETPVFRPAGAAASLPDEQNQRVLRGRGISATYSEHIPGMPGWWWIRGDREDDTKSIRNQLRAYGCDWSRKKRQWFLKDSRELPDGLKRLLGIVDSPAPADAPETAPPALDFRWKRGETVYAACDIERPDLRVIPSGTKGTISGYEEEGDRFKYIVWFDNHSEFAVKDDLLTESAPLRGIQIMRHTQHLDPDGISGAQARADVPATIANNPFRRDPPPPMPAPASQSVFGGTVSSSIGANAFANALRNRQTASAAPTTTPAPQPSLSAPADSAVAPISKIVEMPISPAPVAPSAPAPTKRRLDAKTGKVLRSPATESKPPPLVITSAEKLIGSQRNPDILKRALEHSDGRKGELTGEAIAPGQITPIPMEYVGELTGSVSADIHCYGYALDNGVCVYLNMGGPRTGIEAIRAKMGSAGIVNMTPWDGPAVELTAGEKQSGMYVDFFSIMSERRFYHLILLHRSITHPIYAEQFTTYVLGINPVQAATKIYSHIQQLVNIPVFPEWRDYFWRTGHLARLIRPTQCAGGLTVLALNLDRDAWTSLIAGGIENGTIMLPTTSPQGQLPGPTRTL